MFVDRPPLPDHGMAPYANHMMNVMDYVIILLYIVLVMKALMIGMFGVATYYFVLWRREARREVEAHEKAAGAVKAVIKENQETVQTVREMIVTQQEFLTMAKGWAAAAEAHEMQAQNTTTLANMAVAKATAEVKEEVRAVPNATAAKVVQSMKAESGILDRGKAPTLPPETDEIEIEPGKAPLG